MKFGEIPAAESAGAILAHTLRVDGAGVFKKGRRLSAVDAVALSAAGHETLVAAVLEAGDVTEDEAAARIAEGVAGDGVRADRASTGRCNLRAVCRGVLRVDRERVDRLNRIDEGVTLASLGPFSLAEAGTIVATVKIIPFSVPRPVIETALRVCGEGSPLLAVARLRPCRAGLILTELPGVAPAVLERASASQHTRLARLGARVGREIRCPHRTPGVAAAIRELVAEGCEPIFVLGASAIVDRGDVIPSALVAAGGVVDHLGMPVDPGNLLLLGHLGSIPVIGVPGCARSLKPSGFDWVLRRILAGIPVGADELMAMGVGGLLNESPGRPQPRAADRQPPPDREPRVGAVVLAAGRSRRMGSTNKLLHPVAGVPMVAAVTDAVLASGVNPVVVVTGHEATFVREALAGRAVAIAHNADYEKGLSSSLRVGLEALGDSVDGALICLGDMPWVTPADLAALRRSFDPRGDRPICVPVYDRKRGNPVLWPAGRFAELSSLEGDVGGRDLLDRYADEITQVPVRGDGVTRDVDTPAGLAALGDIRWVDAAGGADGGSEAIGTGLGPERRSASDARRGSRETKSRARGDP